MKGSANRAKGEKQLYFLNHILSPMQFDIAVHINVEMNRLLHLNLPPLLVLKSNASAAVACGPHLTHIHVSWVTPPCGGGGTKWAPSFVSFIVGSDGSNPACTTGRLKNNLSRPMRNKRTKCPQGEISINVFLSFHRCKLDSSPCSACLGSVTLNWLEDQEQSFDR